jgi:hypothetical protein
MNTYLVREGQNLFDVAVQLYGDAQYILQVCIDNGLSLDDDLYGFQPIVYDDTVFKLSNSTVYLALNGVSIVSSDLEDDNDAMVDHNEADYNYNDHN